MSKTIWLESPLIEHFLQEKGLLKDAEGRAEGSYRFVENFKISDIDIAKSLRNQARFSVNETLQLIEDNKLKIKNAIERGDAINSVILYVDKNGRIIVVDGNHRVVTANELGLKLIGAYVIICSDQQLIELLTKTANDHLNGQPLSFEERLAQAVEAVQNGTMNQTEASKVFNVGSGKIGEEVRLIQANSSFGHLSGFRNLSRELQLHLPYLRKTTSTHSAQIIPAICKVKPSKAAAEQFVERFNSESSPVKQAKLLQNIERELNSLSRKSTLGGVLKKARIPVEGKIRKAVVTLHKCFVEKKSLKRANFTVSELKEMASKIKEVLNQF